MSGGVDSSVAALLMQQQGYDCTGVTMRLFDGDGDDGEASSGCCSLSEVEDAKRVCAALGIPHYTFNFTDSFEEKVIAPFVASYLRGATPNPCIECNRHLKFDRLMRRARALGFTCMVTGHYARIVTYDDSDAVLAPDKHGATGRQGLLTAVDSSKDQSYVLFSLTQQQLAYLRLPLGGYLKEHVRELAQRAGLPTAHKGESQDICFVGDKGYAAFIESCSSEARRPGQIVDEQGHVLGVHAGIAHYTIGQRKGLGVAAGVPLYVKAIDAAHAHIVVAPLERLGCRTAFVEDVNLTVGETGGGCALAAALRVAARTGVLAKHRYRSALRPASATMLDASVLRVDFEAPVRDLASGQALVLYTPATDGDGMLVLGGGTISSTA